MRTSRGFRLGRLAGIPVEIDTSWFLIAGLLTIALHGNFAAHVGDGSPWALWLTALAASLVFLASVLVHELTHSVVAVRRGIPVRRIRLFIFGGVSEISQEASSARDEFAIAVVGPVSSIVMAGGFFALSRLFDGPPLAASALAWLAMINLVLGLFNLLPGLPLDGGRVLRAVIWHRTGDLRRSTRAAAGAGMALGILMMGSGIVVFPIVGPAGLWNVFIGWFLYQGALVARAQADLRAIPEGSTVADVMRSQTEYVAPATPAARMLDGHPEAPDDTWFPVLDAWGAPRGAVELGAARRVPASRR